ncbi:MAG: glycosyltransferase family 4 protein [Pyrinomonadaceae bacterium]
MIKVTALTLGKNDPSSRFRVRQFIEPLNHLGIRVTEHYLPLAPYKLARIVPTGIIARLPGVVASRATDITWFRRELITGKATLERFVGGKRLFDVDDAIWLTGAPSFSERIVSHCDGVIAGNSFLAQHYEKIGARVWIVPTSIDTNVWLPQTIKRESKEWTIGWIGTWSNAKYLYSVEEPLADFLAEHSDVRLLIVCDRKPAFTRIPTNRWHFQRWSPDRETRLVQEMDVGLMPLDDTEWTRGKCGFKMLSYMAVGLPVVVSPVGANEEVLSHGEVGFAVRTASDWYEALQRLYQDREMATRMGKAGRTVVEDHYSVERNAKLLANIFQQVAKL